MKKSINLIIRGFLYKENWTPISGRKNRISNYTIDFFEYAEGYKKLIKALSIKYEVNLYFTSYDTTPQSVISKINNDFEPKGIFISPEKDSYQFTTSCTALNQPEIKSFDGMTILIRSDLFITDRFIDLICNTEYEENKDQLYVLCKERNERDKVIDIVQIFPKIVTNKLLQYMSNVNLAGVDLHKVHKTIYTKVLIVQHNCFSTCQCNDFYSLKGSEFTEIDHEFTQTGLTIIKNFFSEAEILDYREKLDSYFEKYESMHDGFSRIISGFAGRTPKLDNLNLLHEDPRVLKEVSKIFGGKPFEFLDHSDLHQNKITGWHRDTKDYERGGGNPQLVWNQDFDIVKVCILPQDHKDNHCGMYFKLGTHKGNQDGPLLYAKTEPADLIIFDQRILHKGQNEKPFYHELFKNNRYLITYAYGVPNEHSDIHKAGAAKRQNIQRSKMLKKNISELKDIHKNKDIYVLGSGGSMDHYNKNFFQDKITIGVNRVCNFFKCNYTVSKDHRGMPDIQKSINETKLICSSFNCGTIRNTPTDLDDVDYIFDHVDNNNDGPIFYPDASSDQIIVTRSTITSAIHIAAYMGAKSIYICGHDGGAFNGSMHIEGYYDKIQTFQDISNNGDPNKLHYLNFVSNAVKQTEEVAAHLEKTYNCSVIFLSPRPISLSIDNSKLIQKRYRQSRKTTKKIRRPR
jgi:hypothetical protein